MVVIDGKKVFDIRGYEGIYGITTAGEVWSYPKKMGRNKKGCWLKQKHNPDGYAQILLSKNGKKELKLVHRLVAETFIPNINNYPTVDHKDRNRTNNDISNLRWATRKTQIENRNIDYTDVLKKAHEVNKKKIKCIETGIIYDSQVEAEKQTGISNQNICGVCKGRNKTAGGYHWEYFEDSDKNKVFVDSKESEIRKEETNGKEFVSRSSIFRWKSLLNRQGR